MSISLSPSRIRVLRIPPRCTVHVRPIIDPPIESPYLSPKTNSSAISEFSSVDLVVAKASSHNVVFRDCVAKGCLPLLHSVKSVHLAACRVSPPIHAIVYTPKLMKETKKDPLSI